MLQKNPGEAAIPTGMSTVVAVAGRPIVTYAILGVRRSEGVSGASHEGMPA